jgi:hypothetical protein
VPRTNTPIRPSLLANAAIRLVTRLGGVPAVLRAGAVEVGRTDRTVLGQRIAESLLASPKVELINRRRITTRPEALPAVFACKVRTAAVGHSTLGSCDVSVEPFGHCRYVKGGCMAPRSGLRGELLLAVMRLEGMRGKTEWPARTTAVNHEHACRSSLLADPRRALLRSYRHQGRLWLSFS